MQITPRRREKIISASLLLFFACFAIYDVILETERATSFHVAVEVIFVSLAILQAAYLLRELWSVRTEAVRLSADAQHWKAESAKWAQGLTQSIDSQFEIWKLSPAEKEVALLLMKGFELKTIGEIRRTTERTARQQAFNLYQKSGLSGRAELTAFFLEDLLVTPVTTPTKP